MGFKLEVFLLHLPVWDKLILTLAHNVSILVAKLHSNVVETNGIGKILVVDAVWLYSNEFFSFLSKEKAT